jgi:protein-S-isoprenylcysteine O-methyltransferase Ste14
MDSNNTVPLSRVIGSLFYLLLFPVILFFLAGDWRWIEGWVYSVIFLLMSFGTLVYLYFHDPALLKERFGSPVQQTQKPWDKVLLLLFLVEFIVWFAMMPLDGRRFAWSPPFPIWIRATGGLLQIIATYFVFEALRENTFAAPVVKMQKERGQKVISTGLYGVVRHPMYAGATLLFISAPLLLGSLVGLAIGFVLILTIGARAVGEEAMLREELEGYRAYMQKVKWRMIPFVF